MSRFHFDVRYDAQDWSEDLDGLDLADPADAHSQAFARAEGLAKDHISGCREITVRVRDGQPDPVMTLRLSLAVEERA